MTVTQLKFRVLFSGNPPPRVVWYRNGKLIDTSDYLSDDIMKNDLTITVLGEIFVTILFNTSIFSLTDSQVIVYKFLARSDLSAELTCEASNNNISRPLATTVHLDMNCKLYF